MVALYLYINFKNKKSFWKPYLDILPKNLEEYIYYYDKKKINNLKETSIMSKYEYNYNTHLENIIEDSHTVYNYLNDKSIKYDDFYPVFLKCRIYICSRIFSFIKDGTEEYGMVPYADLLNHSQNFNTKWDYNNKKNCFEVIATKNIKANTEIYDSYGQKTNFELLLYYGFTIKDNIYSELIIKNKNKILKISKKKLLENNIIIDKDSIFINKLKNILKKHEEKIKKIKDENIISIYNDEISIIKMYLERV